MKYNDMRGVRQNNVYLVSPGSTISVLVDGVIISHPIKTNRRASVEVIISQGFP
jgi:hypothetical protein